MHDRFRTLVFGCLGAVTLASCAAGLPSPQTVEHPQRAFVEVPYPPPAALPETIPEQPDQDVVWIDGEWMFARSSYLWRRGGWVVAPQSGHFAPWSLRYSGDGRLFLASGSWYDSQLRPMPYVEPVSPAATPPNELTRESQVSR